MSDFPWVLLETVFWAGLASLGLALAFNVPRRALLGCVLCGSLGYLTRTILSEMGGAIEPATLGAAIIMGFGGAICARRLKMPEAVFTVTGSILLVPGIFAFRAMMAIVQIATIPASSLLLQSELTEAGLNIVKTGLILGAIAVGISTPGLLFHRSRPVV